MTNDELRAISEKRHVAACGMFCTSAQCEIAAVLRLLAKNAALVAALTANEQEAALRWTGVSKHAKAGFEAIMDTSAAALASVKGADRE